tara:strand:+ start:865 stop:1461 length:597 start_codon:yes stop_codon:yes gene_type:complete
MFTNKKFVLASKSKSRKLILSNNNLNFQKVKPKINETELKKKLKHLKPNSLSLRLAEEKAKSISRLKKNMLVVGSDTIISLNNKVIGKAKNLSEARKKLKKLSGRSHTIFSSAAAYYNNKLIWRTTQKTTVKIRKLKEAEIKKYIRKADKSILGSVGCFQIEKDGPNIIENIKGDFFNVMGFPLFPFLLFLKGFNIKK